MWKEVQNGEKDAKDIHIVFYSCESASVVKEISGNENFKDVTFIAPNQKVCVDSNLNVTIQKATGTGGNIRPTYNYGNWNTYKNGRMPYINSQYSGGDNLRPGTTGFKYKSTFF